MIFFVYLQNGYYFKYRYVCIGPEAGKELQFHFFPMSIPSVKHDSKLQTESMLQLSRFYPLFRSLTVHRPPAHQYIRPLTMAAKPDMTSTHIQSTSHTLAMPLFSAVRNDGTGMQGRNTLKFHI